jgi:hypothetical protein
MATRRFNDEDAKLREVENENEELRQQLDEMQRANEELSRAVLRGGGKIDHTPQMFLVIFALLVLCRMALYVYVEQMGGEAGIEARPASGLFGGAGLIVLAFWVVNEIRASSWLMMPKAMLILVALLISASIFSNGKVWVGTPTAPGGKPWHVLALVLAALLVAATPFCEWLVNTIVQLVSHPVALVSKFFRRRTK